MSALARILALLLLAASSAAAAAAAAAAGGSRPAATVTADRQPTAPDFMPDSIARRAAQADAERAAQQAEQAAAAQVAADLSSQQPWTPPTAGGKASATAQVRYVDLSRAPARTQAAARQQVAFVASAASYPRFPAAQVPPQPRMTTNCPSRKSVKLAAFGARGDGATDDSAAIAAAARGLAYIYFPPGVYRIGSSITLNRPIQVGAGAALRVDAGVTLTLTRRPRAGNLAAPIFTGAGRVVLAGLADVVQPEWFRVPGEADSYSNGLQRAVDACGGQCTLMIGQYQGLTKPVYLNPNVGVFSTEGGLVKGEGGAAGAFVLRPGRYARPLRFATLWKFGEFVIKIQGGVSGAEIQINTILDSGDGIVFVPGEGPAPGTISNVFVTHLTATNAVQNTVVFEGNSLTNRIINSVVRGNFVVSPGFSRPDQQSAGLLVRGVAPGLAGTEVVFQAVDTVQFAKPTKFVMLQNTAAGGAGNVVYRCEAWGGGLANPGQIVAGKFRKLKLLLRMGGGIPSAANFMPALTGLNNRVSNYGVASAGAEYVMPTQPSLAAFNGGKPVLDQVFYVNAPVSGTWAPGEERTFYAWSPYAATAADRMGAVAFRAGNAGIVLSKVQNQHAQEPYRIAITLRNAASYPIPSWQTAHRFGFQVGI